MVTEPNQVLTISEPPTVADLKRLNDSATTVEECRWVASQLDAIEQAARDTVGQRQVLNNLTQPVAAYLIGINARNMRNHPVATNPDGTYNGQQLVEYWVGQKTDEAKKRWEADSDTLKNATERQAEARAVKLEEEAKGLQNKYILREDYDHKLREIAAAVRQEMEAVAASISNDLPEDIRDRVTAEIRNHHKQCLRRLANRAKG